MSIMKPLAADFEKSKFILPTFRVTANGLEGAGELLIQFVKGNKADENAYRQDGITTETLLEMMVQYQAYLCSLIPSAQGSEALQYLQAALDCTQRRTADRTERGVVGTYEK
jgi:hypothetical protein